MAARDGIDGLVEEALTSAPGEAYDGPAVVSTGSDARDDALEVLVALRGHFEPIDGRFHWYGRVAPSDDLAATVPSGSTVVLTTPHGSAPCRLSDADPWGRLRVTGTGRPPF